MNLLQRVIAAFKSEHPLEVLPTPELDRRAFLKILGGSAAVALAAPMLDLEALLWTPATQVVVPDLPWCLTDKTLGISIRFIRQYDVQADKFLRRFDVRYIEASLRAYA